MNHAYQHLFTILCGGQGWGPEGLKSGPQVTRGLPGSVSLFTLQTVTFWGARLGKVISLDYVHIVKVMPAERRFTDLIDELQANEGCCLKRCV